MACAVCLAVILARASVALAACSGQHCGSNSPSPPIPPRSAAVFLGTRAAAVKAESLQAQKVLPPLKSQPVVYEISTRPWLYALAQAGLPANCSNGHGTQYVCLRDVPDEEWLKIRNDHIDMIWLMGIWELGEAGRQESMRYLDNVKVDLPDLVPEDIIGSPYAVVDYKVNPDIGTDDDLAMVREKLHSMGLRVMVDFVPNHFARDSKVFFEHPEAFIQRPQGDESPDNWWYHKNGTIVAYGRGPYDGPWTDTLQINYFSPEAVTIMSDLLASVARRADGIRLDMAHLVLNEVFQHSWGEQMQRSGFSRPPREFWEQVVSSVKAQSPEIMFVAEAYDYFFTNPPEQELLVDLGIDYAYDKIVLDKLGHKHLDDLRGHISSQSLGRMAHFVENHDEPRAARSLGGHEQSIAGAIVALTLPGLRLCYFGQFDGLKNRLGVHLRRAAPEAPNPALHAQYTKLMAILAEPIFHQGTWTHAPMPKDGSAWRLAAWRWEYKGEKRLIVVNFSDQQGWGTVQVADASGRDGTDSIELTHLLTNEKYSHRASELQGSGLAVILGAWQSHIFAY